jgi:hypothetical protein
LTMLKPSVQLDPAVLLLASYGRRCRDDRPCVAAEQPEIESLSWC